jgi:SSS family solute:Na+ symporter
MFSRTGFSTNFWSGFTGIIFFVLTLFGVITYRFRETRCMTFHQFFEIRYSKGLRVFASVVNVFSGLINFGLVPAVGARFFVYFCGLPEILHCGGLGIPTYSVIMATLMSMSLYLALSGGQITVMVTDCVAAVISSFFYLIVAFFIIYAVSAAQMKTALLSGPPGDSYINPFDIGGRKEFNGWYMVIVLIFNLYIYRGSAWTQGFNAAAKTAHEGRMAGIIGGWRYYAPAAMTVLVSIGAFTMLHHPDFAAQRELAHQGLKNIHNPQLQTQMLMPIALGLLLAPGVKGAFCAIGLFGLLASQGVQLHIFGSTFLQDIILPLKKKPFSPKMHLLALQLSALGVGIFVFFFSLLYEPVDYLVLAVQLIGAIYLGGIGALVWGGLYWKKGTTAAAWTAMSLGTFLAITGNLLQKFWLQLYPFLIGVAGHGTVAHFLAGSPDKCPFDGNQMATTSAMAALVSYVVVSLLTCKEDFNMDQMLHRGKYRVEEGEEPVKTAFNLSKLIGIDEHYTANDKFLTFMTSLWTIFWQLVGIGILLWVLFIGKLSDQWWFGYTLYLGIYLPVVVAVITTIWFTIGTTRDIIDLFKTLRNVRRNDADDGTVKDHHNADD